MPHVTFYLFHFFNWCFWLIEHLNTSQPKKGAHNKTAWPERHSIFNEFLFGTSSAKY